MAKNEVFLIDTLHNSYIFVVDMVLIAFKVLYVFLFEMTPFYFMNGQKTEVFLKGTVTQ